MQRHSRRVTVALATAATVVLSVLGAATPAQAAGECPTVYPTGLSLAAVPGVDWSGCDLTGANLIGDNLTGAQLVGTNLTGARLDGINLTGANAANANFTDVTGWGDPTFTQANLSGATFTRTNLHSLDMAGATLDGATFTDATLDAVDLQSATMRNAKVRTSSFRSAKASLLDLQGATIASSNWSGSALGGVMLDGATITNSNFDNSRGAGLIWSDTVTSSGNTWVGATCSDGKYSTARLAGDCLRDLDLTAPAAYFATATGPGTGSDHWYTGPTTVNWNWYEEGAIVTASCPATTATAVTGTVTATCADTAGNIGTGSYLVKIDQTPPSLSATVSFAPNGLNGWYRTAPTVRYTCTDAHSGVGRCPTTVTAAQGSRAITVTAADVAGNTTTNSTAVLKVDSVKPTAAVNIATLNSYGAQVPKCIATDSTSGIASCRLTTAASSSPNYRYATATATDRAGNATASSKVLYRSTTVAAIKTAPSSVRHSYRFTIYVTSKNAKGSLINLSGVRALAPVKTTSSGSGPANTTLSTYATRTATGTYKVTFTAPRTTGYYRYAIRVGNATVTKVIRIT